MGRVSILIPCFNAARYVSVAIESALAQTWSNKEVIVVDDGSTDGSGDIVARFANRNVRLLSQQNRGASAARNTGFNSSSGEYVKFFDADDVMHPELVERQVKALNGSTTAVASAEWGRFYNDDLNTFRASAEPTWRDMDAREWLIEAWVHARPMMQPGLFLLPRPLVSKAGLWNEKLSLIDDFEFFARLLCHASDVRFAPGAPVYYRSGVSGSVSGRQSRKAVESAYHSVLLGTDHLLTATSDVRARRACANILQDFVYAYYPGYADLRREISRRVKALGGSDLAASGPPRFELLRKLLGWRLAKLVQLAAYRVGYRSRPSLAGSPNPVT